MMIDLDLRDGNPIYLRGWGAASGPLRYSNAEVCDIFGLPAEVATFVEEHIGTRFRHTCVDLRTKRQLVAASDMAHDAARAALDRAGLPSTAVQAIIAVSTILDHFTPSTSVRVQKLLGLDAGLTFDLVGGCGVFGQGLMLAAQLLRSGLAVTVMVIASEPLTRHLWTLRRAWEPLAFGDGAAAMLFSTRHPGPFVLRRVMLNTVAEVGGTREEVMTIPIPGPVLPPVLVQNDRLDPVLPPAGFPDALRTSHRADLVAKFAPRYIAEAVTTVTAGIERHDIYVCPHQPSRVVLDGVRERLQLDAAQLAVINPDFGNLSSASSPTAFCVRFAEGPARYPWTVIAPLGTGLTYGAALLERVGDASAPDDESDGGRPMATETDTAGLGAHAVALCPESLPSTSGFAGENRADISVNSRQFRVERRSDDL